MSDFLFRLARPEDREEVLALTANTWEGGDYIEWVFDDWVKDEKGRFLVVEDNAAGRIAGIDKLTFLSPTEAWFEGLRVHPHFRGRGLATQMERFMLGEARRLGAQTVRFLTNVNNTPVHRNAYRHGFSARFVVRHWKLQNPGAKQQPEAFDTPTPKLRAATAAEAPALYEWWRRSAWWQATDGLANRDWSYSSTSQEEWAERSARGHLLVTEGAAERLSELPPPMVLVTPDTGGKLGTVWTISLAAAIGAEWGVLTAALIEHAGSTGIAEIGGLLPDSAQIYSGFMGAGFSTGSDADCLCLFELQIVEGQQAIA